MTKCAANFKIGDSVSLGFYDDLTVIDLFLGPGYRDGSGGRVVYCEASRLNGAMKIQAVASEFSPCESVRDQS